MKNLSIDQGIKLLRIFELKLLIHENILETDI
jgi:hypothetical protein